MALENQENVKEFKRIGGWIKGCFENIVNAVIGVAKEARRLGEEDPRRIIHSLKVGLAITALSLFYYFDFLYQGFGVSAMWAVMTVVVVFEFSVGATLGKGVNRAIATFLGGALGVGAHRLASFAGEKIECAMLMLSVFLIATVATFSRFFPKLKARYDYGLLIFILTFCLISVSGYREDEVLNMAYRRVSTIVIGGFATILFCICICPVWAGADLHKITATNIEKLAIFLEGFGCQYFGEPNGNIEQSRASMNEYKSVLNSKGVEDSLVNFAKWEPRHSNFRYRHPWDQYLKIGSLTRECAYKIDALNGYLNSDVETPLEIKTKIQESCTNMTSECSIALGELAVGMNTMTCSLSADARILKAKTAAKNLKSSLTTDLWPDTDLLDMVPHITVASLLIDIVTCTLKIANAVHELASSAKFKIPDPQMIKQISLEKVKRCPSIEASHSFNIVVE